MKNVFKKILIVFIAFLGLFFVYNQSLNLNAADDPIRTIYTNPGEDSNNQMRISYHIELGKSGSYVLYTEVTDTAWANAKKVNATETENNAFTGLNAKGHNFIHCTVELDGLKSGTKYMYKACLGDYQSDVRYFKTGSQYFNFVWTSDFHAYSNGTRLNNSTANINDILAKNSGADFIFSTGDIVAHGGTYEWWEQISNINWAKEYMFCNTLGNHDWMTSAGTEVKHGANSKFFSAVSNYPKNGYGDQYNVCYYFYYGDALFICLNTEEYTQAQYDWCESVLQNNTAQYIFMFQHYQLFNKAGGANSAGYTRWKDLCDKYGVDIFFSGNSHVYVRSHSIYDGKVSDDPTKGTVYMVAPSSDGDRGENPVALTTNKDILATNWADGAYQVANSYVKVCEGYVSVKLYNKDGSVIDQAIIKAKRGVSDRITKEIGSVDKEELNKAFEVTVNRTDLAKPYINYDKAAYEVVKNVNIIDKDSGKVYFFGPLEEGKARIKLDGFAPKAKINLEIEVTYWDNEKFSINQVLYNRNPYGSLTEFKANDVDSNGLNISWKNDLKATEVKELELLVNGTKLETLDVSKNSALIPTDKLNETNEISLNIIDNDGLLIDTITINYNYSQKVELEKIELEYDAKDEYEIGDQISLNVKLFPSEYEGEYEISSSDTSIAIIKEGVICILKDGTVTIKVSSKENPEIYKEIVLNVKAKEVAPDPEPDPDPEPQPEPKPEPKPEPEPAGGCKGGSIQSVFYLISALGLAFVLRKKRF